MTKFNEIKVSSWELKTKVWDQRADFPPLFRVLAFHLNQKSDFILNWSWKHVHQAKCKKDSYKKTWGNPNFFQSLKFKSNWFQALVSNFENSFDWFSRQKFFFPKINLPNQISLFLGIYKSFNRNDQSEWKYKFLSISFDHLTWNPEELSTLCNLKFKS